MVSVLTAKTHLGYIQRKLTLLSALEKPKNGKRTPWCNFTHLATLMRFVAILGVRGQDDDEIKHAKFQLNRFRGYKTTGDRK